MARVRSISSIEAEIKKVEADLAKTQQKCDTLSARLLELQKQKHEYKADPGCLPQKWQESAGIDDFSGCLRMVLSV
jgi:septal ring factor EnvC (AmiA/AmiB activator)